MDISVVCPFYNESAILENSIRTLAEKMATLPGSWELLIVNDGSTDGSGELAERIAREYPRVRVLGYRFNRGRGHALRTGIAEAKGDIVVTTEIDLSWGDEIVHQLAAEMRAHPEADIVVASPHLPGGGYKNVPAKRVWLSRVGNRVVRTCMSNAATMNTGMTRAYRRHVIQGMPLFEDGKEFHLEVMLKATEFGLHIREIPALLEWKDHKLQGQRVKRKSSSKVNRLIVSHSLFSVFANPVRYVWGAATISFLLAMITFFMAVGLYYMHMVSAYTALLSLSLFIVAILLFVLGVVVKQGNMIQRELWRIQRHQLSEREDSSGKPEALADRRAV